VTQALPYWVADGQTGQYTSSCCSGTGLSVSVNQPTRRVAAEM